MSTPGGGLGACIPLVTPLTIFGHKTDTFLVPSEKHFFCSCLFRVCSSLSVCCFFFLQIFNQQNYLQLAKRQTAIKNRDTHTEEKRWMGQAFSSSFLRGATRTTWTRSIIGRLKSSPDLFGCFRNACRTGFPCFCFLFFLSTYSANRWPFQQLV